jgi:hypothetical protein
LLALVDLLSHAGWAAPLLARRTEGARLHPRLLRLAANATLTADARFDEERFHAGLMDSLTGASQDLKGFCA